MNDTTRGLGSALGVAVLGSVAASRYASRVHYVLAPLRPADRREASSSLTGARDVAHHLPRAAAAVLVLRYLPHTVSTAVDKVAVEVGPDRATSTSTPRPSATARTARNAAGGWGRCLG
jgi:hypothetical protein